MDTNELYKAHRVLEKIKSIDQEIIELDKLAAQAADGNITCSVSLAINKYSEATASDQQTSRSKLSDVFADLHRKIEMDIMAFMPAPFPILSENSRPVPLPSQVKKTVEKSVSDTVLLEVVAVILRDKQDHRRRLINQLLNLGVTL